MTTTTAAATSSPTPDGANACATYTEMYKLQVSTSTDPSVAGKYAGLGNQLLTGYFITVDKNQLFASPFAFRPNCTIYTEDDSGTQLTAMINVNPKKNLESVFVYPSPAAANAAAEGNWVDLICTPTGIGSSISCSAAGANQFQNVGGDTGLEIGDQVYDDALTLTLVAT